MGTRSLTIINDEQGKEIVVIYQQFDGHPSGVGKTLHELLKDMKVINGISGDARMGTHANGMTCLAAQLVAARKDEIGNVYLCPAGTRDCWEEYRYHISLSGTVLLLKVESGYDTSYEGPLAAFDPEMEGKETA